jgi:nicotinamide-nucleotide amidase
MDIGDWNPMTERLDGLAAALGQGLADQGLTLATAESCTGGWVAKVVTDIPGSSAWFDRGFVTYSNQAKEELLGVSPTSLDTQGAVSEVVVREMALGALARSHARIALAVSGIAGPDGGSDDKPVGSVWFAWALPSDPWKTEGDGTGTQVHTQFLCFAGNREEIRHQAVHVALERLLELLPAPKPGG